MPINEFAENREFFNESMPGGFDTDAFKKFVEQYGIEFAKGYFTAIKDYLPQIEGVFIKTRGNGEHQTTYIPSQFVMKTGGFDLLNRMELVLHFASAFNDELKIDNANISPPKLDNV